MVELEELRDPNFVLYLISGTHSMYGRSVPLYIGMTKQLLRDRISQHSSWLRDEADPPQIYAAAISEMTCWEQVKDKLEYPPPEDRTIIEDIESLLIYAHQLAYNQRSKQGGNRHNRDIVVFNTGKRSGLLPEVSTMNWYGDTPASAA